MASNVSCLRTAAFIHRIEEINRDPRRRREWLWLRAREKDDPEAAASLERADDGLAARMAAIDQELGAIEDPRARSEAYGRRLDRLMDRGEEIDCRCPACLERRRE